MFEILEMARRKLPDHVYATISGTNRAVLERMTFRPRLMVNVTKLDLSLELFGSTLFAPIVVGPVWRQEVFHPEGELAMARGAAASKSAMMVSGRSSKPLPQIVEAAGQSPLWYQAYPDADPLVSVKACQQAVKLGCKAVCITLGVPYQAEIAGGKLLAAGGLKNTWETIDRIKQGVAAPLHPERHPQPGRSSDCGQQRRTRNRGLKPWWPLYRPGLPIRWKCCLPSQKPWTKRFLFSSTAASVEAPTSSKR